MIRNHKKPLTRTRGQARRNLPWSSTVPSSARPPIHYQRQRGRQRGGYRGGLSAAGQSPAAQNHILASALWHQRNNNEKALSKS